MDYGSMVGQLWETNWVEKGSTVEYSKVTHKIEKGDDENGIGYR